jgi:hypothetical protein
MKWQSVAVLFAALFLSCEAVAQDSSANVVMESCRHLTAGSPSDQFGQGVCAGAVGAIFSVGAGLGVCAPQEVTRGQTVQVVMAYIDSRPARLHESFYALALEALRNAWPCR